MAEVKRYEVKHVTDNPSGREWNLTIYGNNDISRQWSFYEPPRASVINTCVDYFTKFVNEKGENKYNG